MARRAALLLFLVSTSLSVVACAAEVGDSRPADGAEAAAEATPPGTTPPVDPPDDPKDGSIVVTHERQLRGAWISTVYNGTWPSRTGLTPAAAKAELTTILDALAAARMNAVFFQVRAESDAFYPSMLEPWSRFLTGTQGQDPGWDPLAFAIEEGHKRGIEVHAWLNPYRGLVSAQIAVAPTHVTKQLASAVRPYGGLVWMDPGVPEVRAHILDVVHDILQRYDVDGIHFDDYFYPYPKAGETFDDAATYAAYTAGGGGLTKDEWRRKNVDTMVRETSELVTKTRASVRFGVSPFGIYRPGTPPGITGLDAYATLYCDPVRWMDEGWVDYLAPQLYWPTTQTAQAFGKLVAWWAGITKPGRSIFVGHDATKAGTVAAWAADEYDAQMTLAAAERPRGVRGNIFFSAKPLVTDQASLRTTLVEKHWTTPASTPALATASLEKPGAAPLVSSEPGVQSVTVTTDASARYVAVYRETGTDAYVIERLVPTASSAGSSASTNEIVVPLESGRWAISIVDRRGVESRGTPVIVE